MWFEESNIYQIYPLGMCGCPWQNPGEPADHDLTLVEGAGEPLPFTEHRIDAVENYIEHIKGCGCDTVLFNPLFESDAHGYDTRNMRLLDRRLGTNEDLKRVCGRLREAGLRVMFDGVFNHVGRGFFGFQDVLKNREHSPYLRWFHIDLWGDSPYHDGLSYEAWEGCYDLVKLNLGEPEVRRYIFDSIRYWYEEFGISGLRLDVAYCLDRDFLRELRSFTRALCDDFFLFGEIMFGDYKCILSDDMMDSVTNYECQKGLVSSINSMNLFEIAYSLNRQFGPDPWALYPGRLLQSFVDNHDLVRAATALTDKEELPVLYGLLYGMPGIPTIYYGSEWGMEGEKREGDHEIRMPAEEPEENELTRIISSYALAREKSPALMHGDYRQLLVTNRQLVFERSYAGERVIVAVNADREPFMAHFDARAGLGFDLLDDSVHDFGGGSELEPLSVHFWRTER